jgi:hypothetical protein
MMSVKEKVPGVSAEILEFRLEFWSFVWSFGVSLGVLEYERSDWISSKVSWKEVKTTADLSCSQNNYYHSF